MRLIIILTVILACGCSENNHQNEYPGCDAEIEALINERGEPERITPYDSESGYHNHGYWYWAQGYARIFRWGGYVEGCNVSDLEFDPIIVD